MSLTWQTLNCCNADLRSMQYGGKSKACTWVHDKQYDLYSLLGHKLLQHTANKRYNSHFYLKQTYVFAFDYMNVARAHFLCVFLQIGIWYLRIFEIFRANSKDYFWMSWWQRILAILHSCWFYWNLLNCTGGAVSLNWFTQKFVVHFSTHLQVWWIANILLFSLLRKNTYKTTPTVAYSITGFVEHK